MTARELHIQNNPYENLGGAFQIIGRGGTVPEVEANTKAVRSVIRPCDLPFGFGTFCFNYNKADGSTVLIASATNDTLVGACTWNIPDAIAVIRKVTVLGYVGIVTTSLTAGFMAFKLMRVRNYSSTSPMITAWTVSGTSSLSLQYLRMPKLITRVQDPALILWVTNSTPTTPNANAARDASPIGTVVGGVKTTSGQIPIPLTTLYEALPGEMPMVLSAGMGLDILWSFPAASTVDVTYLWQIVWDEYDIDPGIGA